MLKSIHSLTLLLLIAPTVLLARQNTRAACSADAASHTVAVVAPAVQQVVMASVSSVMNAHVQVHVAQPDPQPDAESFQNEKAKTFEKTYKVNKSDVLSIDNRFGKVHINTWNKNEVQVRVNMVARANSEQRAQEILDKIKVMEYTAGGTISLKTTLESMNVNSSNGKSFEINYTVSMPENNALSVKNQFGDVYLGDMKGEVTLDVRYGTLKAERLTNASNSVKIAYCSGSSNSISFLNKGTLDISYSDITIGGANNLQGLTRYTNVNVGNLNDVLNLETKYGSLKLNSVGKNMQSVNLASAYTSINMAFEDNAAFNFDISLRYADFSFNKENATVRSLERSHTSAEYKGNYGSASPKGNVSIVSRYGDVRFAR